MALKKYEIKLRAEFPRYVRFLVFQRFMEKVKIDREGGCWEWLGRKDELGRGIFDWNRDDVVPIAVASYRLFVGKIPIVRGKKLCVCHSCDNPGCANPFHLWLGTQKQNIEDMIIKGRQNWSGIGTGINKGERHGMAKLTEYQVRSIRELSGDGRTQTSLAKMFGVSEGTISMIVNRQVWKDTIQ